VTPFMNSQSGCRRLLVLCWTDRRVSLFFNVIATATKRVRLPIFAKLVMVIIVSIIASWQPQNSLYSHLQSEGLIGASLVIVRTPCCLALVCCFAGTRHTSKSCP
jgi:hypothetical protein